MRIRAAILAALLLACDRQDGEWEVTGIPIPDSYQSEIWNASNYIRGKHGILPHEWGGKVNVVPDLFICGPDDAWMCSGLMEDFNHIKVVFNPFGMYSLGLGCGTTAIEHEFCHVALGTRYGDLSEDSANACAADAIIAVCGTAPAPY